MHHRARSTNQSMILSVVLVLTLTLVFSCSDEPTGIKQDQGPSGLDGTEVGCVPGGAAIAGVVFSDDNQNGVRDGCEGCEPGIPDITVVLNGTARDDRGAIVTQAGGRCPVFTRTSATGQYKFAGLREGVYTVAVVVPVDRFRLTSKSPLLVTLVRGPDGKVRSFLGANFGLFPIVPPPTDVLFGPIIVGPASMFGTILDSTFVNPPSPLTVVFTYVLDVMEPPWDRPFVAPIDSAKAWINGQKVFEYHRTPPDSMMSFPPQTIKLPYNLVPFGKNTIKIMTAGGAQSALMWKVTRIP